MAQSTIVNLNDLAAIMDQRRENGDRIVLCHGTFDLLHYGHLHHLREARSMGDLLVVTITADRFVRKGPDRPVFDQFKRAEMLAALECVDYVSVIDDITAIPSIRATKPHIYAKGHEYKEQQDDVTGNIAKEERAVTQQGGSIAYTDGITFSSSHLINRHLSNMPDPVAQFLATWRMDSDAKSLVNDVRSCRGLNVLVVGDTIVDEYHYTTPLGQTGKGNILAVKHESVEQFAGGVLAVANHLSGFVDSVTLFSGLGRQNSLESFIRGHLQPQVTPHFLYRDDAPTIVKRRYVDQDLAKLFEVYYHNDLPSPAAFDRDVCQWLDRHVGQFDLVVVPDFGHGFISRRAANILASKAQFLAVNTQVNSGNRGFHSINRYPRADFVSLNEPELRMAAHNRIDPLEDVAFAVAKGVNAKWMSITRGTKGVMSFDMDRGTPIQVPALSTTVLDRIGAGDAFLSLASLCLAGGLSLPVATFVGSVAAALDVQIICNRSPIDPVLLFKTITTLMK